jgi:RNA polymerase sigma-70 factor (ECF subfamily)
MPLTDADILSRVQNGEQELFGQLVVRYAARFLRVATSKLGDRVSAEDVVQETFLAAFAARDSYNSRFAVSTWLWTILLNRCRARWKHWCQRPWEQGAVAIDAMWDSLQQEEPSTLAQLIAAEDSALLHRLLNELPEPQADALRLRFFGGLAYEEIATAMDSSLSGAKRRVKTGLEKLSTQLRSIEHFSSSGDDALEDSL